MRADLQAVFVFVQFTTDGVFEPLGEFDSFSGGSWSVDGTTYYQPGSDFPVNRGGKAEIDDAEVGREWQRGRDDALYTRLKSRPNLNARYTRHDRLDDLSVVLKPWAQGAGKLLGVSPPEYDSQSADSAMFSLTIGHSGPIG